MVMLGSGDAKVAYFALGASAQEAAHVKRAAVEINFLDIFQAEHARSKYFCQ